MILVVIFPQKSRSVEGSSTKTNSSWTKSLTGTDAMEEKNSLEQQLEELLEKTAGISKVKVMITYDDREQVEGVVVAAKEGNYPEVQNAIIETVQVLFAIETCRIKVLPMK